MTKLRVLIAHHDPDIIVKLYDLLDSLPLKNIRVETVKQFATVSSILRRRKPHVCLVFCAKEAVSSYRPRNELSEVQEIRNISGRTRCLQIGKRVLDKFPNDARFNSNVLDPVLVQTSEYIALRRKLLEKQIVSACSE